LSHKYYKKMKNNFAAIISDTSRSKIYLSLLIKKGLIPNYVLYMRDKSKIKFKKNQSFKFTLQHGRKRIYENLLIEYDIIKILNNNKINFEVLETIDIHEKKVINKIKNRKERFFIYSGYPGVILKKEIINLKKTFIHVHGGYLPKYKGSTTNYYSILKENKIGASSIIMSSGIDEGPILKKKYFLPPKKKYQMDKYYDSFARGVILIETIKKFDKLQKIKQSRSETQNYPIYYIIHPVLKHISILEKNENNLSR